jgi:hypothetical protein
MYPTHQKFASFTPPPAFSIPQIPTSARLSRKDVSNSRLSTNAFHSRLSPYPFPRHTKNRPREIANPRAFPYNPPSLKRRTTGGNSGSAAPTCRATRKSPTDPPIDGPRLPPASLPIPIRRPVSRLFRTGH